MTARRYKKVLKNCQDCKWLNFVHADGGKNKEVKEEFCEIFGFLFPNAKKRLKRRDSYGSGVHD